MLFRYVMRLIPLYLVFFCLPLSAFAAPMPDIVAKVGNLEITKYELRREYQRISPPRMGHAQLSAEKVSEMKFQALDNLIDQACKAQYAFANEMSVPNTAVDERLAKVRERFKTDAELTEALAGESIPAFRASVYRMLLAQKAEDLVVNEKAKITDEEVRAYYDDNKQMYMRPPQYRASHILIKVDPTLVGEQRQALLDKAEDLAKRAKAGEDFYNLAYYNSDEPTKFVGGDTGYFHSGQVVKEFEDAIKNLQPGEIVGPVETIAGFHVIKLTEAKPAHEMTFEEVAGKIRSNVEGGKKSELYDKWMAELKKQYPAEVFIK
ncbi:peptidyl-prolyl cis-trans isomerase C [Malonomonas rubra DSM 5091]|uniref:Peptidyl-prolyl cis-trans isomerase C n=1 Tax=Malonomonas rubra DSM 5091 TaxID=1122189 RepID=A0A1M6DTD6_MALRU|nr:peptidylprolyl isomerase [Malonomonas rubra]SHI76399.1 peptidyl-prolyl cis-trans isomerase C [Malonomonas rubra DSM 5091]